MCSVAEVDEAEGENKGNEEEGCEDNLGVSVSGYEVVKSSCILFGATSLRYRQR
jgi:hypothetical protein